MKLFNTILCTLLSISGIAQDQIDIIDIENYDVQLHVNDSNDIIIVSETVHVKFLEDCASFYLDLTAQNEMGKGMLIHDSSGVTENQVPVEYRQQGEKLIIKPLKGKKGHFMVYKFTFSGIPTDGLVIGKNKFGARTFFGDNWPNRAHNWFACIDHPADKATIQFTVIAPDHYDCIATGELNSNENEINNQRTFVFASEIMLPTKVMVVGLADFTVEKIEHKHDFPITSWVYPQDAENGLTDMAVAKDIVSYFIQNIGEYPFDKLANVQSTTRFGGMENAGNIFYDENAVKGDNSMEALIAHEIAHQWFGNSASESDWPHIWLSEGFATYFTDLYWEDTYGDEAFKERLRKERNRVIHFSKKYTHPVVDTTYASLMDLLNPNSYQKGAWVLHMLRRKVGNDGFWEGVQHYYETYKYGNASTDDFINIMEEETQMELSNFFDQWLRTSGHPILEVDFKGTKKKSCIRVKQVQHENTFTFPMEIELTFEDGSSEIRMFNVTRKNEAFTFNSASKLTGLKLDPNVNVLIEEREH